MDKTALLEDLKKEIQSLKYEDVNDIDRLQRKTDMLIRNIFGEKSSYLNDFVNISFCSLHGHEVPNGDVWAMDWETDKARVINLIETMIDDISIFPENSKEDVSIQNKLKMDKNKVFIVHGHDDGAVDKVARFVSKLGFEAIILHEQSSSGDTIIEKIIRYSDVGFGIVLYTECDIGGVKADPQTFNPRARQNVVFEHGFLIGKIGRKNIVALVKGNVEKPNDISGVVYISLDESQGWKLSLVREMRASGYDIDMNKVS